MENGIAIGIVFKLLSGKRLTAKQISEKYEISTRTVYRYINHISSSGIPLISFSGKNGGIEIDKNFIIDKNFFTANEVDYLLELLKNQEKTQKNTILIEKIDNFFKKQ